MPFIKMPSSLLVAAIALVALIGCGGKDKQNDLKTASEQSSVNKKSAADTSDIFKEFYSDDTAGQDAVKKTSKKSTAKNQTFSPASANSAAAGEFSQHGPYVVQVSCVPSKPMAEKLAATLKEKNFPVYIAAVHNPTPKLSGTYYRVRIGGFNGIAGAKSFGQTSLVAAGYEYWVDKKSNDKVGMEGYSSGAVVPAKNPASSYEGVSPSPSSWSSVPAAAEPAKAPAGTSFTPSDGFLPSAAPATEPSPVVPASAPSAAAPAAPPAKATPAPVAAPAAAPTHPASATPAADKSAAGTGEWSSDSSSNTGGW